MHGPDDTARRPVHTADPDMTIGDAIAAGRESLSVFCVGCRCTVQIPWGLLRQPHSMRLVDLLGRLRCRRCGTKPTKAKLWSQRMAFNEGRDLPEIVVRATPKAA